MAQHYDALETRSADERAADLAAALPQLIRTAQALPGYAALGGVAADEVTSIAALADLPVLRKGTLMEAQAALPPLGGFAGAVSGFSHVFQSPGPITSQG